MTGLNITPDICVMTSYREKFLELNSRFWITNNTENKPILVYCQYQLSATVVIMDIAKYNQQKYGGEIFVVPFFSGADNDVISSYGAHLLDVKRGLFKTLILHGFSIVKILLQLKTGKDILRLKISGVTIGEYLYDAVLKLSGMGSIKKVESVRKRIIFKELLYYFFFQALLKKLNPRLLITGDLVYRDGFFVRMSLSQEIPVITAISPNSLSATKYKNVTDLNQHCRRPPATLVDELVQYQSQILPKINRYLQKRISGKGQQHDELTAYAHEKKLLTRSQFNQFFSLEDQKPTVVILSHVFPDAPHGNPSLLFYDYERWLINTLDAAAKNTDVNWLVKPHPSMKYYHSVITVKGILQQNPHYKNVRLITDDLNTMSLFDSVDMVVTCGGTAGLEFSAMGIPVVIAAVGFYSGFGFTNEFEKASEYLSFLQNLSKCEPLSAEKTKKAQLIAFAVFILILRIDKLRPIGGGFGSEHIDPLQYYCYELEEAIKNGGKEYESQILEFFTSKYSNLIDLSWAEKLKSELEA
jgi:hypothetical protein